MSSTFFLYHRFLTITTTHIGNESLCLSLQLLTPDVHLFWGSKRNHLVDTSRKIWSRNKGSLLILASPKYNVYSINISTLLFRVWHIATVYIPTLSDLRFPDTKCHSRNSTSLQELHSQVYMFIYLHIYIHTYSHNIKSGNWIHVVAVNFLASSLKMTNVKPLFGKSKARPGTLRWPPKVTSFVLGESDGPSPQSACPARDHGPGSDASPEMGRSSAGHLGKLQADPGRAWHSSEGPGTWKYTILINTNATGRSKHRHMNAPWLKKVKNTNTLRALA